MSKKQDAVFGFPICKRNQANAFGRRHTCTTCAHGCGPLSWGSGSQRHRIVASPSSAQASVGDARLLAHLLCMASRENGELCRSSSRSVQLKLQRASFAQVCGRLSHLRHDWHAISLLPRAFHASYRSCHPLTRMRPAPHMPRAGISACTLAMFMRLSVVTVGGLCKEPEALDHAAHAHVPGT